LRVAVRIVATVRPERVAGEMVRVGRVHNLEKALEVGGEGGGG
jgi:hypothetical protein